MLSVAQYRPQTAPGANPGTNARRFALPGWIMLVVAGLVIVGGIGVYALTRAAASPPASQRTNGVTIYTTPGSSPAQSTRSNSSPVASKHPVLAGTPVRTSILTCSGSSSQRGNFTFSGGVAGTILLSTFQACYSSSISCYTSCSYNSGNGGHTYFGKGQGEIKGVTYEFEFLINPYLGPGAYTSGTSTNVMLMQNNHEWESYGARSNHTSIVVGVNGKTGTIRATISMMSPLYDPASTVSVTGSWSQ